MQAQTLPVILQGFDVIAKAKTGTGKTTVCELYAQAVGQTLHMINCHQHTETADIKGGPRAGRPRAAGSGALALELL